MAKNAKLAMPVATKKFAPFGACAQHGAGCTMATGKVHSVSGSSDGSTVNMTVKHEPPERLSSSKRNGGMFDYTPPHETQATMPVAQAKGFAHGDPVEVHVRNMAGAKKGPQLKTPPKAIGDADGDE